MTDRTITIETVAEVQAVHQQTIKVSFYPATEFSPEDMVQLSHARYGFGDLQFISFPADKAEDLIEGIRRAIREGKAT